MTDLSGWFPIRFYWQSSQPVVDWCYLGQQRFIEPFFEDTINKCLRHPFSALFRHQTPAATLTEWQKARPGLLPAGFIFHLSRCGSSLVSQMLAALPQNIIMAEAHPVDQVLRSNLQNPAVTDSDRIAWLQGMISALGQPRSAEEKYYFIKFDSWSTIDLPLIRKAFPDVPWLFLYRDPVEVMASHMKQRGVHLVPGLLEPELFGFDPQAVLQMQAEEYGARVLAEICASALAAYKTGSGMLINYQQLPDALYTEIPDFFGVNYSSADLEKMRDVALYDAKNPSFLFVNDAETKKLEASDGLYKAVEKWVGPVYAQLEFVRSAGL